MGNLDMQKIFALNEKHPDMSLEQLIKFIMLASKIKNDIILVQPTSIPESHPPNILPPSITLFLQNSCTISEACVTSCWEALKSTVWYDSNKFKDTSESDFAEHGHPMGLCAWQGILMTYTALICFRFGYLISSTTYLHEFIMLTETDWEVIETGWTATGCLVYLCQGSAACSFGPSILWTWVPTINTISFNTVTIF